MEIINAGNFNDSISTGIVVVDFFADWCGPCKMLSPVLEELSKEMTDVKFFKVNVDDNNELAARFGIQAIPNIVFFKDGKAVNQLEGFRGKEEYQKMIATIK